MDRIVDALLVGVVSELAAIAVKLFARKHIKRKATTIMFVLAFVGGALVGAFITKGTAKQMSLEAGCPGYLPSSWCGLGSAAFALRLDVDQPPADAKYRAEIGEEVPTRFRTSVPSKIIFDRPITPGQDYPVPLPQNRLYGLRLFWDRFVAFETSFAFPSERKGLLHRIGAIGATCESRSVLANNGSLRVWTTVQMERPRGDLKNALVFLSFPCRDPEYSDDRQYCFLRRSGAVVHRALMKGIPPLRCSPERCDAHVVFEPDEFRGAPLGDVLYPFLLTTRDAKTLAQTKLLGGRGDIAQRSFMDAGEYVAPVECGSVTDVLPRNRVPRDRRRAPAAKSPRGS